MHATSVPLRRLALESIILEQWLRFYWLDETHPTLHVPESARQHILSVAPYLLPLADRLAACTVDASLVSQTICNFLAEADAEHVRQALDDPDFQHAVEKFQIWIIENSDTLNAKTNNLQLWLDQGTSLQ